MLHINGNIKSIFPFVFLGGILDGKMGGRNKICYIEIFTSGNMNNQQNVSAEGMKVFPCVSTVSYKITNIVQYQC